MFLLSSCGSKALKPGSIVWCKGLAAPWHVWPSWIKDQTCVSGIAGQILYCWATREAPSISFWLIKSKAYLVASFTQNNHQEFNQRSVNTMYIKFEPCVRSSRCCGYCFMNHPDVFSVVYPQVLLCLCGQKLLFSFLLIVCEISWD